MHLFNRSTRLSGSHPDFVIFPVSVTIFEISLYLSLIFCILSFTLSFIRQVSKVINYDICYIIEIIENISPKMTRSLFYHVLALMMLGTHCCAQSTEAPTAGGTVPGIATLRPTSPTMPPIMMPGSDPTNPENKTEELPIVVIYFIMFGISCVVIVAGVFLNNREHRRLTVKTTPDKYPES